MPEPGVGLIYQDPGFLAIQNLNFEYSDESPCIDAGNPNQYDPDGTIRDIGANIFSNSILGDCNSDNDLSILDVVYLINSCILDDLEDCSCSDINNDGQSDVLDVVTLVNLILN